MGCMFRTGKGWRISSSATLLALGLLASISAQATDRTVYFVATGTNRTSQGLGAAATSTCRIIISNPSSYDETFKMTNTVQSLDPGSSSYTTVGTPSVTAGGSCPNSSSCSGTVTAGSSVTITFSFTPFLPRSTAGGAWVGALSQTLRCSGSILVHDTTQPGFLIASGQLVTFVESSAMHTDASTGGSKTFGGIAVYSQVPIVVNRGKPF